MAVWLIFLQANNWYTSISIRNSAMLWCSNGGGIGFSAGNDYVSILQLDELANNA
jgi:hypothetical protein